MKKFARDLEFISIIKRDGSGVQKVEKGYLDAMLNNSIMKNEKFDLHQLSITKGTYIAFCFNAFVVRLK